MITRYPAGMPASRPFSGTPHLLFFNSFVVSEDLREIVRSEAECRSWKLGIEKETMKRILPTLLLALFAFVCSIAMGEGQLPMSDNNLLQYGNLRNCRVRFEIEKKGHVAFIGGSITQMNGYRPMVMEILEKRFPNTRFTFTDAGISSTCSTTGAFRLKEHVLSKGPVDLFFIEFAVNDDQDAGHALRECIRGMEGIVRQTRTHNPKADIVMTYFVNPHLLGNWQKGKENTPSEAHSKVARHYGVCVNHLGMELANQISAKKFSWRQFGGVHPGKAGNRLCANMIDRLMDINWKDKPVARKMTAYNMPPPLDKNSYYRGRVLDSSKIKLNDGVTYLVPEWKSIQGGFRNYFAGMKLICMDKAGTELSVSFEGTAVGAYVLAGPDAGIVEASVDGEQAGSHDLYHRFSSGLHYPRTVMFATDLNAGKHVLTLKISEQTKSKGHAMRVLHFVAN